ncbi:hypothetical protein M9435_001988 [Picochlorum sp. BPE23]|nr:hypothetical protein M9435_001988 [Picochlorum sp. BPE23]
MALPAACLDPTWRPVCARAFVDATVDMMMISHALLLHAAVAKKFRPRRANTWKHPTPLFQRGLLAVAVPEPAEQYSKAAKKNFRRRQNKNRRFSVEEGADTIIPSSVRKGGAGPEECQNASGNISVLADVTNDGDCNVSLSSDNTDVSIKTVSDTKNARESCSTRQSKQSRMDSSEDVASCDKVAHVTGSIPAATETKTLSNSKIARKNRRRRRNKLAKRQEKEGTLTVGLGPQEDEIPLAIKDFPKTGMTGDHSKHTNYYQSIQAYRQDQQAPYNGLLMSPWAQVSRVPEGKQVIAMYEEQKEDGNRVRFVDHNRELTSLEKIAGVLRSIDLDSLTKDEGPHPQTEQDKHNGWILLEEMGSMESHFIVRKCIRVCESLPHPIECYQVKCIGGAASHNGAFFSFSNDGTPWQFTREFGEYFCRNRSKFNSQQEEEDFTRKEKQRLMDAGMKLGPDQNPLSDGLSSLVNKGFVYRGRPRQITKHTIFYKTNPEDTNLSPAYKTKMLAYKVYYKVPVQSSGAIQDEYHLGGEHLFYPSGQRCALPINGNSKNQMNDIVDCICI